MRALVQRHSEKAQDRRSEAPRPSRLGTLLGGAPSVRAQMALAETLHARPAVQAASRLSAAMSQSAAPVQRTKNDAKAFITEHNLNINANGFEMDDVVKYAKSRGPRFQELLARWNKGGGPKIVDDMLKPKREKARRRPGLSNRKTRIRTKTTKKRKTATPISPAARKPISNSMVAARS